MGSTEIVAAEPQLFVTDFECAVGFYVDALGFELAFTYGEPAFYGQARRCESESTQGQRTGF